MINSGTVDIRIDPYTHANEYSSEPVSCRVLFLLRQDMLQTPGVKLIGIPVNQQLVHYASFHVTDFVLFSCSRVRHHHDQIMLCLARR
jgi:hypothetical protein